MLKSSFFSLRAALSLAKPSAVLRFNNSIEMDRLQATLAGVLRGMAAPASSHVNR
jgi:hypothetical protein